MGAGASFPQQICAPQFIQPGCADGSCSPPEFVADERTRAGLCTSEITVQDSAFLKLKQGKKADQAALFKGSFSRGRGMKAKRTLR